MSDGIWLTAILVRSGDETARSRRMLDAEEDRQAFLWLWQVIVANTEQFRPRKRRPNNWMVLKRVDCAHGYLTGKLDLQIDAVPVVHRPLDIVNQIVMAFQLQHFSSSDDAKDLDRILTRVFNACYGHKSAIF
jgi:hypothetical protein